MYYFFFIYFLQYPISQPSKHSQKTPPHRPSLNLSRRLRREKAYLCREHPPSEHCPLRPPLMSQNRLHLYQERKLSGRGGESVPEPLVRRMYAALGTHSARLRICGLVAASGSVGADDTGAACSSPHHRINL